MFNDVQALILAAGSSSRFRTKKTKLLHTICGQEMILYPAKLLDSLNVPATFILGHQADKIKETIRKNNLKNVQFVTQKERLGTGNAVECSKETWTKNNILIINGDIPLIKEDTIRELFKKHEENNADISFVSTRIFNPTGYGRIVIDNGSYRIIEEKECSAQEKEVNVINSGIYLMSTKFLSENLSKIPRNETLNEYFITHLIKIASDQGLKVQDVPASYDQVRGVNTLEELWATEQIKRSQLMKKFMYQGVRFELAQNIHLDADVEIGTGSFIATGVHLLHGTKIGEDCFIGAFSIIDNTTIGKNSKIYSHTVMKDSITGCCAKIGPFARLRDNVKIEDNVTIGNFVEIKNTTIGEKTKMKHLTYLGDATIGKSVNIGAGTITCNHDGTKKNKTIIEDEAFIGSNNTLVAPIKIMKKAYTAAGSTLTKEVKSGDFAIARSRQVNKKDYAKKLKKNYIENDKNKTNEIKFVGAIKTKGYNEETL